MEFAPSNYGPVFAPLLGVDRNRSLSTGTPGGANSAALSNLDVESAFAHTKVVDGDMASCCIAGAWLLYDQLDASHTISQGVHTTTGSFWHGIMHRREGDFSNAKYWFGKVGEHDIFPALAEQTKLLAAEADSPEARQIVGRLVHGSDWAPFAFVDACQAALRGGASAQDFLRRVQQSEWELLFDYGYTRATA